MISVATRPFGKTTEGAEVTLFTLRNQCGAYVELMNYGCAIRSIVVPDKNGKKMDVCLGYDTLREYEENDGYLGAVVGRHANRIEKGRFDLNGTAYSLACNNGPNHLHGGARGFDRHVWHAEILPDGICFSRLSPDGEEGYPGNLQVQVAYRWSKENGLTLEYTAQCDRDTLVNLTNHCYFNLNGGGSVLKHMLTVHAQQFLENDAFCLPTGKFCDVVSHAAMDFRRAKPIGRDILQNDCNLRNARGYDHNYVLFPNEKKEAAVLYSADSGIQLRILTDQPGLQVYSGNFLTERIGKNGCIYRERDAVCLETQKFPNALACGFKPAPILRAGERLQTITTYQFSVRRE